MASPISKLIVVACAFACTLFTSLTQSSRASDYLNPIVTIAPTPSNLKSEVLLMYVNETAPSGAALENMELFLDWLHEGLETKGITDPAIKSLIQQFVSDRSHSPAEIDRNQRTLERADLKRIFPNLSGVALLTNRLAQKNEIRIWKHDTNQWATLRFDYPTINDPIRAGQPNGVTSTFKKFLEFAHATFDTHSNAFVLLFSSHGNAEMVATPRLFVNAATLGKERILRIARGLEKYTEQRPGISKDEFYNTLADAGNTFDAFFSYVFTESCESGTLVPSLEHLPRNIEALQTTAPEGTTGDTIYFPALLSDYIGQPIAKAIQLHIASRPDRHYTKSTPIKKAIIKFWPFLLVTAIFTGVFIYLLASKRMKKP